MRTRSFNFNIIVRLLFIIILSSFAVYFFLKNKSIVYPVIFAALITILAINLIIYMNSVNRKISFFFDAVRNNDSSLSFPSNSKNKSLHRLYDSMNRVNDLIQQLKIENRQQEQYFRTIIEHLATGIITFNAKGFVLHTNSSARKLLTLDVFTHLKQVERIDKKLFQTIKNIKPFEQRLVSLFTQRGEIQLSLKAASLKSGKEELTILSIQDIKSELDEKELDSWLKLIRVLMHEIMNSITPITSLSENLSNSFEKKGTQISPEEVTEKTINKTLQGLNVIREQGKGLMSFVESYRKLTKLPEPVKKTFKVSDLMDRVSLLYDSLEKGDNISLSFSIKQPDIKILADENLISQVLINLIKNAIEANELNPEGQIIIIARLDHDNKPEICVSDNGPGIEAENLDEIFVPFFTTKNNGSGIGLSISRQIMRVHGGTLKVSSTPYKETIFCLGFQG